MEESFEFLGIWLVLVGMLGLFSVFSPSRRVQFVLYAWAGLIATAITLISVEREVQKPYIEANVMFETDLQLYAYQVERFNNGSRLHVHVHLSPGELDFQGLGYSIDLVDQASLTSVANRNTYTHFKLDSWVSSDNTTVYRQWTALHLSSRVEANRALWTVLTLWREQDSKFIRQKVLSSDLQLLSDTQVVLDEFVIRADSTSSSVVPMAEFDTGFALESVDMPQRAVAGRSIDVTFTWRADEPSIEDHIQFLHFVHEESGEWWVYDQHPLGARLPTRLWYMGLADSEIWQVPVPDGIEPGRYKVFTGLYRASDKERVPVTYADEGPWLDNRVALSDLLVQ